MGLAIHERTFEESDDTCPTAEADADLRPIEDVTGRPDAPIYDFKHAIERVTAAMEAVKALPFPFTFTARVVRRD